MISCLGTDSWSSRLNVVKSFPPKIKYSKNWSGQIFPAEGLSAGYNKEHGGPVGIWTLGRLVKSQSLCLTELRAQLFFYIVFTSLHPGDFSCHPAAPLPQGAPLTPVQPSNYSYPINSFWLGPFFSRNSCKLTLNLFLVLAIFSEFFQILPEKYMYENIQPFKSKAKNLIYFSYVRVNGDFCPDSK